MLLALAAGGYFMFRAASKPTRPPRPEPVVVTIAASKGWQDAHVDVEAGQSAKVVVSGKWRKLELAPCGDEGVNKADLDKVDPERAILPKEPFLCLLARVGDADPVRTKSNMTITPDQSGRLFLRVNDLDVEENSGGLR